MERVEEAFNNYMSAPTWFQETYSETHLGNGAALGPVPHRLLLGGVRHPREHPHLLGRLGSARRRPPQGRVRPRYPVSRRRTDVPRGATFASTSTWTAGNRSATPKMTFSACRSSPRRKKDGTPLLVSIPAAGAGAVDPHLAHPSRPSAVVFAGHQHPAETARRIARRRAGCTAATTTCASARRWSWAWAASARLRAPRQAADGLPHERGAFGLLRAGAHPLADGGVQHRLLPRRARR